MQAHRREPVPQRAGTGGQIAREPLQASPVCGAAVGMHAPHPRDVLARERDHEVGVVELLRPWPGGCGGRAPGCRATRSRRGSRQLIGMPSITCVPDVVTFSPGTCSRRIAPAITERAALPVHSVTTWRSGIRARMTRRRTANERSQNEHVPYTLVLLRHGQSTWNLENLFTGWIDVDLTEQGAAEARRGRRRTSRARASCPTSCTRRCRCARSTPPSSRSTSAAGRGSRCGGRGG